MPKLSRTQKYAELRDKLANDAETSVHTEDLSQFENKLKSLEDVSAPVKDETGFVSEHTLFTKPVEEKPADVHEYIFSRPETVEEPAPGINKYGFADVREEVKEEVKPVVEEIKETVLPAEEKVEDVHEYIFTKPEDIPDSVSETIISTFFEDTKEPETIYNKDDISFVVNPETDRITVEETPTFIANPAIDASAEDGVEEEKPAYVYNPEANGTFNYVTEEEPTEEPAVEEPVVVAPVVEEEEKPAYVYNPEANGTFNYITEEEPVEEPVKEEPVVVTVEEEEKPTYVYNPEANGTFNYVTEEEPVEEEKVEEPVVITPVVEEEEKPAYVYNPEANGTFNYITEEEKVEEPVKEEPVVVTAPVVEEVRPVVENASQFINETLAEVNAYNKQEGRQTVDEISPAIINQIRGHVDEPKKEEPVKESKPAVEIKPTVEIKEEVEEELDADNIDNISLDDEEFSNTVSLEINKIISELKEEKKMDEPIDVINVVEKSETVPEVDASNYTKPEPKVESSFIANYMRDTVETPIVVPERNNEIVTNPTLVSEDDDKKDEIEIKNYSEVEEEIKNEVTMERTLDSTIPFVVGDKDVEEEDEEDSASNKLLNVILIVLIVALIAVLGVIVYYILLAKGVIA